MHLLAIRRAPAVVVCLFALGGCGSVAALPGEDAGSAEDSSPAASDSGTPRADSAIAVDAATGSDAGIRAPDATAASDTSVATFRCGPSSSAPVCDTATQYCLLQYSGGPAMLPRCEPIPATCNGTPSCACTTPPDAGAIDTVMCSDDAGAVTVSEGCLPCQ